MSQGPRGLFGLFKSKPAAPARRDPVAALLGAGAAVRLKVGSAARARDGFLSVDVRDDSGADVIADMRALPDSLIGQVDEIYSRHAVEHLSRSDAKDALTNWKRILKPGGRLHVIVPDLAFHVDQFKGLVSSDPERFPDQFEHAMAGFFGWSDPDRGGQDWDIHRWGYSFETLKALLENLGYRDITRLSEGEDTEPWHLNVTCLA